MVDCFEERPDAPVSPIFKVEGINVLVNLKMIFTNPLLVRKTTVDMVSDEALVKEFIRKIPRANGTPEVISRWMLDNLNNGFFDSGSVYQTACAKTAQIPAAESSGIQTN